MKDTDEQIRKWLADHADQLGPEELVSEEEKQNLFDGSWPTPQPVDNMGAFAIIRNAKTFDEVIGNPNNWAEALTRTDLFEKWIIPHAVLCYGKTWFDRVKWRNSISKGVPFPLFAEEERQGDIESTPQGRARIAQIVEKISVVMRTYLEGKWYDGSIKSPGGYIVDSLKNEFVREIGADLGYKTKIVPACPQCLSSKPAFKVPLIVGQKRRYSCPRCSSMAQNLKLEVDVCRENSNTKGLKDALIRYYSRKRFEDFLGITCVCPSDSCPGNFVPLSSVDVDRLTTSFKGALKGISVSRNTQKFRRPPKALLDFPLTCPYCRIKFTPRDALQKASGFRQKSGFLTGLPVVRVWIKSEDATLDSYKTHENGIGAESFKDQIAAKPEYSDDRITTNQRLNMLIGEIIIKMSRIRRNTVAGLTTWYFLAATIMWMKKYSVDAHNYFFNYETTERELTRKEQKKYPGQTTRKVVTNTRGKESAVHQTIFHEWMDMLEMNITEFTKLDPKIRSLGDFSWFAHRPKFSGGPGTKFYAIVSGRKIPNDTPIREKDSKRRPRLARVSKISKDGIDFTNDIDNVEWQAIQLNQQSDLKTGDNVLVEGLVMSDHPTHAPIQRILRLRSGLLKNIIHRILSEENMGNTNPDFWQTWRKRVEVAREKTGISVTL